MKPITKVYAYKNKKTGELVGKLFVSKPTSDSYSWKYPNCKLVECEIYEKIGLSDEGCVFCGNTSEYEGEAVCLHCNSLDDNSWYECEKCGKKWKETRKEVLIKIEELK